MLVCNSIVAMVHVIDLWCHLTYHLSGAWHTMYAMLHSNYKCVLPKNYTMEKFDFFKSINRSQIILFSVICAWSFDVVSGYPY